MKKLKSFEGALVLIVLTLFVYSLKALAEDPTPLPDSSFWQQLLAFVSGWKGQSTLAIVAGLVQLGMVFFSTSMGDWAGLWKWVIVSGLSMLGVLLGGVLTGNSWIASLTSGAFLAAAQVWIHQLLKLWQDAKQQKLSVSSR